MRDNWIPIILAPMRKTVILGKVGTELIVTAYWPAPKAGWRHANSSDPVCFEPTHFMYLPKPPKEEAGK